MKNYSRAVNNAKIKQFSLKEGVYENRIEEKTETHGNRFIVTAAFLLNIRQHKRMLYTNLLTSRKLNGYLADLDKQAEDMLFRLIKQMAECEGVTEQLKAKKQMEWVARINNIRSRATEIAKTDLIYTQQAKGHG